MTIRAEWEKEAERWAQRLNWLHTEYGADCSGVDSGDPLDCVEVEIRQVVNRLTAELLRVKGDLEEAKKRNWWDEVKSFIASGGCPFCGSPGDGHIPGCELEQVFIEDEDKFNAMRQRAEAAEAERDTLKQASWDVVKSVAALHQLHVIAGDFKCQCHLCQLVTQAEG